MLSKLTEHTIDSQSITINVEDEAQGRDNNGTQNRDSAETETADEKEEHILITKIQYKLFTLPKNV